MLGHAGRKIVACAAQLLGWTEDRVCREASCPLLLASSIKAGLDLDWSDPDEKGSAIPTVIEQLTSLEHWVAARMPDELTHPPLDAHVATLRQIIGQDLEPDPDGSGRLRIRHGVAEDRRVSIEDKDMRHGRKTKSKRFNGYKAPPRNRSRYRAHSRGRGAAGQSPRTGRRTQLDRGHRGSRFDDWIALHRSRLHQCAHCRRDPRAARRDPLSSLARPKR